MYARTSFSHLWHRLIHPFVQGEGQVSGTLATDLVSIGSLAISDQAFGAVSRESDDFNDSPNDGLMGLAFGTIAQSKKPTFFENLIQAQKVAAPLFSVHLTRNQASGSEVSTIRGQTSSYP